MKKVYVFILASIISIASLQSQDQLLFHFNGMKTSHATSVTTAQGEIVTTGYSWKGNQEEENDYAKPFICKKDHHGNVIWMKAYRFEYETNLFPKTIIKTSDEGYLVGGNTQLATSNGNLMFLLKVNADGIQEWFTYYSCQALPIGDHIYCADTYLHHVTENNNGAYIVSASQRFESDTLTSALLMQVDGMGNNIYSTAFNLPGHQENYLYKTYQLDNDDYIALVESTQFFGQGALQRNTILKRMDAQFNTVWERILQTEEARRSFEPRDLTIDTNGDFVVLGLISSEQLNILTKVSKNGSVLWGRTFTKPTGYNLFRAKAVTTDFNGDIYFCGFSTNNQPGTLAYAIKTNSNGVKQWAKKYGKNYPFADALDIEMIQFPPYEITFGDFVFVGTYADSTIAGPDLGALVAMGATANGGTGCKYNDLTVSDQSESYIVREKHLQETEIAPFILSYYIGDQTPEYMTESCSPFNFPLVEQTTNDQMHLSPSFEKEQENFKVIIAPNPNNGNFEVNYQHNFNLQGKIYLFDSIGRLVSERMINESQTSYFENLPKGTYLVKITTGDKVFNQRIIVQ